MDYHLERTTYRLHKLQSNFNPIFQADRKKIAFLIPNSGNYWLEKTIFRPFLVTVFFISLSF